MKKRLLLITLDFWPNQQGGVATYYHHVCTQLSKHHDVFVLTHPLEEGKKEIDAPYTIIRHPLTGQLPFSWIKSFFVLKRLVSEYQIDHVFVGQVLPLGTVAWLLHKLKDLSYSLFFHGMDLAGLQGRKKWLAMQSMKYADTLYCNSNYTCSLIDKSITTKRHIVSPCPNEDLLNISVSDISTVRPRILTVCRLVKRKGVERVIMAVQRLKQYIPDFEYLIVGSGPECDSLQALVKNCHLQDTVSILSDVDDARLAKLYASCDVFVMTPIDQGDGDVEGFGIVYLEANLFGKPVIGTRTGGVTEAISDNKSGMILDSADPQEICQALLYLLSNDDIRNGLGSYGRERVRQLYTWEAQVQGMLKRIV